ncbi:MAG: NAD-dependent epimerase [Planctomycetaceae bacterium]|jgi:UDP-glucuronate 4-epimerase|nr:NAD-dependent epimerase [Planctomycetaceae bacterium]MBT4723634.1 NAD-dependent epimerase [Planctomycetaceae bacterium]MBT4845145.1 NAD-dependent epimerase [Planctomycetaceae bacterium]MBT5125331.1 NAD-dependent epimerase [Planctomycetaceae bacterium]MBT5598911.1 NAD-dependent epimerase [Planctomycetaceae bacterium]
MKILVTGAAGFIGYHASQRLLHDGHLLVGVDNMSDYYDVALKQARLECLQQHAGFEFRLLDIADRSAMADMFQRVEFDVVINLAAQAGVRYSLENPAAYIDSNIVGFANVLEGCRQQSVGNLIYASSSSVYGANTTLPFAVTESTEHPLSLYGATKKSNELMAHAYSHLYRLPTTGLRFFTVYGPWGRPDMALSLFASAICSGEPIKLFNQGDMLRSFTYIDDVVESMVRLIASPPKGNCDWDGYNPDPASSQSPFQIFNVGGAETVELKRFVQILENCLGRTVLKELLPMQLGDVPATEANVKSLQAAVDWTAEVSIEDGIARFCDWFKEYYGT